MLSVHTDSAQTQEQVERRLAVRRKEDYFWLKRLSDISGDASIIVNRDLTIAYTDPKLYELLRIAPEVGERLETFTDLTSLMAEQGYFGPGDPHVFEALMGDLLVNQRLKQNRTTQLVNAFTPCGRHIDIRVSLGRDDSYLVLVRDNTGSELKKRALDTALKVGESGYWFYNLFSGEFRVRADSLRDHFRAETFGAIMERGFMQVVHEEDRAVTDQAIRDAVATRKSVGVKVRIVGDDGAIIWLSSHIMPNIDENGKVRSLACFFTNITKEIEVQNELRGLQETAELALKAKNEFLGRLSHEVRTPMNAVIGLADAVVHQNKDQELSPQLKLIQSSAEKIVKLVDETLEHSKLEGKAIELNLEDESPRDIVQSSCDMWKLWAAKSNTDLVCKLSPNIPETLTMDSYRYEQCLNNLISNAIKFSEGGKVQVVLTVSGSGPSQQLVLAVRDTGIGMTKEELKHVFLPFKQADNSISERFGGTGLGLAITKDLVELMGGKIKVSSEPGKGSLFVISIPTTTQTDALSASETEQEPTPSNSTRPSVDGESLQKSDLGQSSARSDVTASTQTSDPTDGTDALVGALLQDEPSLQSNYSDLRVLIVDDNATNHIVVSSLLSTVVGDIKTALNGQEAIDALEMHAFDLVLMDIHMPVMDGIEATLAIRSSGKDYCDVPIIALTADPQYQQARLCKNIGMNESLAKPIKLTSLLQAFDDVLSLNSTRVQHAA